MGARYRYVTGNPYTPVVGAYFDSNADRYMPINGAPFSARLPAFNQLDLRVDKMWTFDRWRFSIYLDVQNVTRATNAEAIDYNFDFTDPAPAGGAAAAADHGRAGGLLMARASVIDRWPGLLLWRVSGGCKADDELPRDASIDGPRVLVITAEPPSVPPGGSTHGHGRWSSERRARRRSVSWTRCLLAPRPGDAINPDCVDVTEADYLEPLGERRHDHHHDARRRHRGRARAARRQRRRLPDAGGPRDRRGETLSPPTGCGWATGRRRQPEPAPDRRRRRRRGRRPTPLDEATPLVVHAGDRLTLQAALARRQRRDATRRRRWAARSGHARCCARRGSRPPATFSEERTEASPANGAQLDELLPAAGQSIDLYAVTRDDRGGVDYVHRTLRSSECETWSGSQSTGEPSQSHDGSLVAFLASRWMAPAGCSGCLSRSA